MNFKKHQVAQRQEVQQRQVVQHWRVSSETLLEIMSVTLTFFQCWTGTARQQGGRRKLPCRPQQLLRRWHQVASSLMLI